MIENNARKNYKYQVVWESGYTETIEACQVSWPGNLFSMFTPPGEEATNWVNFHAEVDGHWTLVLQTREDSILSIRNLDLSEGVI